MVELIPFLLSKTNKGMRNFQFHYIPLPPTKHNLKVLEYNFWNLNMIYNVSYVHLNLNIKRNSEKIISINVVTSVQYWI